MRKMQNTNVGSIQVPVQSKHSSSFTGLKWLKHKSDVSYAQRSSPLKICRIFSNLQMYSPPRCGSRKCKLVVPGCIEQHT
jgi:hypothetical protein